MNVDAGGGRQICVEEAGDPAGLPVVVHHGPPMAGLLYAPWVEDAEARGIRLIAYDRPGYGGSAPDPGRTVASAAADVEAICDALGVGRFATWGISGGGPHALACAALLPDRVVAAASLAGVAPYDADGLDWTGGMGESNVEEFAAVLAGREVLTAAVERGAAELLAAAPDQLADSLATLLGPVDRAALTGGLASFLHASARIGLAGGSEGWIEDDLAFVMSWGFAVEQIAVPVLVWQGRDDRFVPFAHGEWLAARIPGAEPRLTEVDGHLTLLEHRVPEVHAWLAARFEAETA